MVTTKKLGLGRFVLKRLSDYDSVMAVMEKCVVWSARYSFLHQGILYRASSDLFGVIEEPDNEDSIPMYKVNAERTESGSFHVTAQLES